VSNASDGKNLMFDRINIKHFRMGEYNILQEKYPVFPREKYPIL
jgi:hypothetical protein